jgi:SMC interacting uncharacterized protein involved in chromosome segregation
MEIAEHERIFDEIRGKLNELNPHQSSERLSERLEKMQFQLKKSQEELFTARLEMEEKIKSMETLSFTNNDLARDLKRQSEQLEQERATNSKLSADLAKSLELNLKLQYEIEEIRARAQAVVNEEKKHNMFLQDKVKTLSHELELSQALNNENRLELSKAKEELSKATESLEILEEHAQKQSEVLKNLSEVAENKLVELKLAVDKKTSESQDAFSQLQQALSQIQVLRQENSALKEYIHKISALNQRQ